MKYAISNIAFPPAAGASAFSRVAAMGFEGLEVAPSRAWQNTWTGLTHRDVAKYRKEIESGGLSPVGLHSLLFDQPHLAYANRKKADRNSSIFLSTYPACAVIWVAEPSSGAVGGAGATTRKTMLYRLLLSSLGIWQTGFRIMEPFSA